MRSDALTSDIWRAVGVGTFLQRTVDRRFEECEDERVQLPVIDLVRVLRCFTGEMIAEVDARVFSP